MVYISPVAVESEILEYYTRLLNIGPSSNDRPLERVHIVTPDLSLSPHPLPLSTLLTINPRFNIVISGRPLCNMVHPKLKLGHLSL